MIQKPEIQYVGQFYVFGSEVAENMMNSIKFLFVCNLSSALAPIKMYITLTSSDG